MSQLLPQDVVVLLKLSFAAAKESYAALAAGLGLSPSQVHASVQRGMVADLVRGEAREVNQPGLLELIIHGVKYAFPARPGPVARGLATAHSAPPLSERITGSETHYVWPDPTGTLRGESVQPLHKCVLVATKTDPRLYASLALIDAIRIGRARERKLATALLREQFQDGHRPQS